MADIPVPEQVPLTNVVVTSAGQTVFAYDFRADKVSDMRANYYRADGSVLAFVGGVDFTVSGIGNPAGGTITLTAIADAAVGETMAIYRSVIIDRLTDFQRDLLSSSLNLEFDKAFMIMQELRRDIDASLRFPPGVDYSQLPFPDDKKVIGWDGRQLVNIEPSEFIFDAGLATAAQGEKADTALQPTTGVKRINMQGSTLTAAVADAAAVGYTAEIIGEATTTAAVVVSAGGKLRGSGPSRAKVKRTGGTAPTIIALTPGVTVEGLALDNFASDPAGNRSGHAVRVTSHDFAMRDSTITDFGLMTGTSGGGTGVLVLESGNGRPQRPRLSDMRIVGNMLSEATIGWLLERTDYGFVSHVIAEDIVGSAGVGYAHELKNDARWNNLHALTAINSEVAVAYGQDTVGIDGAKYNVAVGMLGHKVRQGILTGEGVGNVFSAAVFNMDDAPGTETKAAVLLAASTTQSAAVDVAAFGTQGINRAAMVGGNKNYVSVFSHTNTTQAVEFLSGAANNVVEILHPGARSSILGATLDNSGAPTFGIGSNVTFCQATGEWLNSLSGLFRWYLGNPGAAFLSTTRFQYAYGGDLVLGLGTPDAVGQAAGILHAIPGDGLSGSFLHVLGGTRSADLWYMTGWGTGTRYVWAGTTYRPVPDNSVSLGLAANRWSTVYAGTGTINTSDAREKTAPLPIDDAVLDAWGDVRLIAYQWLDAVAAKGELARVHHGVIAQQVRDAFAAHGLDGLRYGLLCHDAWDAEPETTDEDGNVTQEARPAGDRWGIRADQCLWLEAAYQRRRCDRIEARIDALEKGPSHG